MEVQKYLYHSEAEYPLMFIQIELFNILVLDRSLRFRELCNKVQIMREFDTGYILAVRKQVKSIRKYGVTQKLVFKAKGPYKVLEKNTPISYWIQSFPFCEGLGSPGRKVKESATKMEKIPPTMVLHKHLDVT